ncbi:hypothetical protein [Billgrantia gudaonensis]|uniref:Uncharacterized protein n=1 Tax=Billgrantia gudaonensis TaxID=376427 RepID=A0A1G9E2T1_9GAMM|nr:hypothetical protein [Halomonas gudaonensis]SDK70414.1 hypothetical protein SAMN04487954_1249 [Halomonas gudaonensis]
MTPDAHTQPKPQAPHLASENVATAQLWRTRNQRRATAIDGCIEHLMVDHDMTERAAEDATLQAYADLESLNKVHAIELAASTSRLLVIKTPGGARIALTVSDLLSLLKPYHLEAANRESRRLLVLENAPH